MQSKRQQLQNEKWKLSIAVSCRNQVQCHPEGLEACESKKQHRDVSETFSVSREEQELCEDWGQAWHGGRSSGHLKCAALMKQWKSPPKNRWWHTLDRTNASKSAPPPRIPAHLRHSQSHDLGVKYRIDILHHPKGPATCLWICPVKSLENKA